MLADEIASELRRSTKTVAVGIAGLLTQDAYRAR